MTNQERMTLMHEKLTAELQPSKLNIIDESYQHIGHAGAQSGAGHFAVEISSDKFQDLSKIKTHQLIYQAVGDLIPHEVHALRICILT